MKLGNSVSAAALAVVLGLGAGAAAVVVTTMPAIAQTTLSVDQIAAIKASVKTDLSGATSQDAKMAAVAKAMADAVALYGVDAIAQITDAVMTSAEANGIDNFTIGQGLAQESGALITAGKGDAAKAIAMTVANEANQGEKDGYTEMANSQGNSQRASRAGGSPSVTGGTGGAGGGGGGGGGGGFGFGGGTGGGGGGGCLNPSCTHV